HAADCIRDATVTGVQTCALPIYPVPFKRREQVINLLRRMHLRRKNIVDLVIEQVAPLFAHVDELTYLVVFFFNRQRQRFLPWSEIGRASCRERRESTAIAREW